MRETPPSVSHDEWMIEEIRKDPAKGLGYLNASFELAIEDNDPGLVLIALARVAKARGMTRVAKDAKLQRESLHRMLSKRGNPEWSSIFRVFRALGLQPQLAPIERPAEEPAAAR